MSEKRKYKIAGKEYSLKENYTLKEWGKILKAFDEAQADENDALKTAINLIAGDNLEQALNLILDRPLEDELMETDIEEVGRAITDFFSRKSALTRSIKRNLTN